MSKKANRKQAPEKASERIELETEAAKLELEKAKIQERVSSGWQNVMTEAMDRLAKYSTQRASGERRFTMTLSVGILVFLVIVIGTLSLLSWRGIISGESLLFFLGTLAGSLLMLVAERVKSQR
jgi:hypothetical protein